MNLNGALVSKLEPSLSETSLRGKLVHGRNALIKNSLFLEVVGLLPLQSLANEENHCVFARTPTGLFPPLLSSAALATAELYLSQSPL